jgi:serine protease Do
MRRHRFAIDLGLLIGIVSTSCLAEPKSSGTGFAISGGALIITNNHVVEDCATINIPELGPAEIVRSDRRNDVALLKPSRPLDKGLRFRSGRQVRLGEEIVVLGFPLRGVLSSPPIVTTGIVSSLAGIQDDRTRMQISAPVQPGNSGGPVIDKSGNVVGIVVSKLNAIRAAEITGDIPQNVNFAIHSSIVTSLLDSFAIKYEIGNFEKEKSTSDLVAESLPAIVPLECLGERAPAIVTNPPAPSPRPMPDAVAPTVQSPVRWYPGKDAPGNDLGGRAGWLRDVSSADDCMRICLSDRNCVGFTYNIRYSVCIRKGRIAPLINAGDPAVTGVISDRSEVPAAIGTNAPLVREYPDMDAPGHDRGSWVPNVSNGRGSPTRCSTNRRTQS